MFTAVNWQRRRTKLLQKKQPFPLIIDTMSAIVDFTDIKKIIVLGFHDALKWVQSKMKIVIIFSTRVFFWT